MHRLQPFLAIVAGIAAAIGVALGLNALLVGIAVGTCVLFATGLRLPGQPEPAPVASAAATPMPAPATATGADVVPEEVRAFLDGLPGPLLVIGGDGKVSYVNAAAQEALPNARVGRHHAHLIRAPAFLEALAGAFLNEATRDVEFTSPQGGADRIFEARLARMRGLEPGAVPQVMVLLEDRTRVKRAEQLRSDFIANASHELRTPLATIIGYVETLQNHARDDAEARQRFLGIMAREAARMQRLVDDLMSLSRIEMNEHMQPGETLALRPVVAECAAALQPLAAQHGVRLTMAIDPEAPGACTLGDRDQLMQVFTNLIDNAIKYGGTEVTVEEAPAGRAGAGRIGISVRDAGPGIPREHLPRLTERFYRANVGQSRSRGGTGLGLAIVKHILNRHRGRLEIASEPGRGSSFTAWLPLVPDRGGRPEELNENGSGTII